MSIGMLLLVIGSIFIILLFFAWLLLIRPAHPSIKIVDEYFPKKDNAIVPYANSYDYYKKIVVHHKLYEHYLVIFYIFKVISFVSTLLTVYNVVSNSQYTIYFAIIAAIFEGILILAPLDKYASIHIEIVRIIQDAMNDCAEHGNDDAEIARIMNQANKHISTIERTHYM